jgi:Tol biopolymer transport system component
MYGSDQTLPTNSTGEPKNFQYSSDGQYICFDAPVGDRREVFIIFADGSNLTQLTTEGGYSPVIQPRE